MAPKVKALFDGVHDDTLGTRLGFYSEIMRSSSLLTGSELSVFLDYGLLGLQILLSLLPEEPAGILEGATGETRGYCCFQSVLVPTIARCGSGNGC